MKKHDDLWLRRRLLLSAIHAVPAAILAGAGARMTFAAAARLDAQSAAARALGYAPDGASSDRSDPAERCGACLQFGGAAEAWGPCAVFQGREVSASGWCRAFTRR